MAMQKMVSTRTNPLGKLLDIFEDDPALSRKVNKKLICVTKNH